MGYGPKVPREMETGISYNALSTLMNNPKPRFSPERRHGTSGYERCPVCGAENAEDSFRSIEKDFNVPLINSEQMYQALRSLGVATQLVIYPNQFHGLTKPSYQQDRLERMLDWYGRYLKNEAQQPASGGSR